ncbi:hypothetical protein BC940DRAFT_304200 [Gongronella butleri]|nr:hypothetical protein BC940DRAFT_304200 [Gongronella butleri]
MMQCTRDECRTTVFGRAVGIWGGCVVEIARVRRLSDYRIDSLGNVFRGEYQITTYIASAETRPFVILSPRNQKERRYYLSDLMMDTFLNGIQLCGTHTLVYFDGDVSNCALSNLSLTQTRTNVPLKSRRDPGGQLTRFYEIDDHGNLYRCGTPSSVGTTSPNGRRWHIIRSKKIACTIPVDELLVDSFMNPALNSADWIVYKDGDIANCKKDNLALWPVQAVANDAIQTLERASPGEQFRAIAEFQLAHGRIVDFKYKYLVSDRGRVFSIRTMQLVAHDNEQWQLAGVALHSYGVRHRVKVVNLMFHLFGLNLCKMAK